MFQSLKENNEVNVKLSGQNYAIGRVFCVGRNYVEHARELNDEGPASPIIFSKFPSCLVQPGIDIPYPKFGEDLNHEVEIVVLIGKGGKPSTEAQAESLVAGLAVGLDLTMRDVQQKELIPNGLPWEKSKAFECSAPIGEFVAYDDTVELDNIEFACSVDGVPRQLGNTSKMVFPILKLLVEMAKVWTFRPGDLVFTGTPEGVGSIERGETVSISAFGQNYSWRVC